MSPKNSNRAGLRLWAIVAGVVLLFALLAFVGFRLVGEPSLATLVNASGPTERDTRGTLEQWRAARAGDGFSAGDGARTLPGSVANFRLAGGAKLRLNPSSQIRFEKPDKSGRIKVDVDVGDANVESGDAPLTLESEFGPIELDGNSSIRLHRDGSRLSVSVELGTISLNDKTIAAGSGVELELGGIVVDIPTVAPSASAAAPAETAAPPAETAAVALAIGAGVPSADLVVRPGESFIVHDPSPPTAIGFRLSDVCKGPARLSAGAQATEALGQANLAFAKGQHRYEVRCLDEPGVVKAGGTIRVLEDAGTAQLPSFAPTASVVTDGRTYTVMYQHRLPKVTVNWPSAPEAASYSLKIGSRTITTQSPSYTFGSLPKGRHNVVFSAQTTPIRQSRATTIEVVHDTQAPAGRVSESSLGESDSIRLSGQALPGWDVSVGGQELEVDASQKFSVEVPGEGTVPITFSHPGRDTHYYLRRPKTSP
jgi:hypothetical protein